MTPLETWLQTNVAGTFGTELGLADADYTIAVDDALDKMDLAVEPATLDYPIKAVARASFWLHVMTLVTGSKDTFERALELYGIAQELASAYLPETENVSASLLFYDPYKPVLNEI